MYTKWGHIAAAFDVDHYRVSDYENRKLRHFCAQILAKWGFIRSLRVATLQGGRDLQPRN
jgi:hypothetical protein